MMAKVARVMLVFSEDPTAQLIERSVLTPAGHQVILVKSCKEAEKKVVAIRPDLLILGDDLTDGDSIDLAKSLLKQQPTLSIILFTNTATNINPQELVRLGLVDWLNPPLSLEVVREAVERGLQRREDWQIWLEQESKHYTGRLLKRVDELEALSQVGRSVTALLDLDEVLKAVVDAAVETTSADEGSIMLVDEESGELYIRAGRNFQDDFVKTFRLPVDDSLAGEVVTSGEPILIGEGAPRKIQTEYLVHSLIYVPLFSKSKVIGVLGVDNRDSQKKFNQEQVVMLSAMADYASVAIDNANLYSQTEVERSKLSMILTQIEDGVLVVDSDEKVVLMNKVMSRVFGKNEEEVLGKLAISISGNPEENLLIREGLVNGEMVEILGEDGRTYHVRMTDVEAVGTVITFNDISYLKELDRLKTDFVSAVSHDLRSPLTSILGYTDLLDRVGDVNEKQAEFIKRVETSVHHITNLISDLVNLNVGRIEMGMMNEVENVDFSALVNEVLAELDTQVRGRKQSLNFQKPKKEVTVRGDITRLRQMIGNLVVNASKYTPEGGEVAVSLDEEEGQVIFRVTDTGVGIPAKDQSNVFNRYFRASNVKESTPGSGLGLAITKSIVENHGGRIWVQSEEGKGSTFTVVLNKEDKK